MNRDIKIGLVLGLLLLGTVAAFFFRNEPSPEAQTQHLEHPEALAEELKDTEGPKPYLQDSSIANRRDQELVKFDEIQTEETDAEFSSLSDSSPFYDNDFSYEESPATPEKNRSLTQEKNWFEVRSRPPPPIAKREASANHHQTAHKSSPQQTRDAPSNRGIEKVRHERAASASELRTHRVRPGETLSSLATYYLGSDSRFMELYQFNKDVLNNPHRLQVGMTLRIPPTRSSRAISAETQTVSTTRTPQRAPRLSNDRPTATIPQEKRRTPFPRFLPIRRSPFLPGPLRRNN